MTRIDRSMRKPVGHRTMSGNICSILNKTTGKNYTVPVILLHIQSFFIVPPVSCVHLEISQQHIKVDIYLAQ